MDSEPKRREPLNSLPKMYMADPLAPGSDFTNDRLLAEFLSQETFHCGQSTQADPNHTNKKIPRLEPLL